MCKNLRRYWQRKIDENMEIGRGWKNLFIFCKYCLFNSKKKPNFFITRIRVIKTLYILSITETVLRITKIAKGKTGTKTLQ